MPTDLRTCKSRGTETGEGVHAIQTGGVVLTRLKGALVDLLFTVAACITAPSVVRRNDHCRAYVRLSK